MDYKLELQKNNEELNEIIDKAKALPDAGGASGGLGMDVATHSNGATELARFYGGTASITELNIGAAFESAVNE